MHLGSLLLSGLVGWLPVALLAHGPAPLAAAEVTAAADPITFLGDGRIQGLTVAGAEVAREDATRNGFAVLWFNGQTVKTLPLHRVTREADGWVLRGDRDLPRCTIQVQAAGAGTAIRLVRVEGFPRGRDASVVLHLGLQAPLRVSCAGSGVLLGTQDRSLDVTWTFPGQDGALATYAAVLVEAAP